MMCESTLDYTVGIGAVTGTVGLHHNLSFPEFLNHRLEQLDSDQLNKDSPTCSHADAESNITNHDALNQVQHHPPFPVHGLSVADAIPAAPSNSSAMMTLDIRSSMSLSNSGPDHTAPQLHGKPGGCSSCKSSGITTGDLSAKVHQLELTNHCMVEDKKHLSNQLAIQTKVNHELKLLLVASVGENLETRYEKLLSDKVQLQMELDSLRRSHERYAEQLDQLSAESELWKSRFLACGVIYEELMIWKSSLQKRHQEAMGALQSLQKETASVRRVLQACYQKLVRMSEVAGSCDPSLRFVRWDQTTALDTAMLCYELLQGLAEKTVLNSYNLNTSEEDVTLLMDDIRSCLCTRAESLALQVLNSRDPVSMMGRLDFLLSHRLRQLFVPKCPLNLIDHCHQCQGSLLVL